MTNFYRILFALGLIVSFSTEIVVGQETAASSKFEFADGDRVVLLGGTFFERMAASDYFETYVTLAYPDRSISFRNLGWSGDDVFGTARAVFGSQEEGFKRLKEDLERTKPTVLLISYGQNESFKGEAGLEAFLAGYRRLLDTLAPTQARMVLLEPFPLEDLGPPLPNPTEANKNIALYAEAIRKLAAERNLISITDYKPSGGYLTDGSGKKEFRETLTDNGVHLTPYGYWKLAPKLAEKLGVPARNWNVQVDLEDNSVVGEGATFAGLEVKDAKVTFQAQNKLLPVSLPPRFSPREAELVAPQGSFRIVGLEDGVYGLNVNGAPAVKADAKQWANGVLVNLGQFDSTSEQIRQLSEKKNMAYFHRYRPQNETYLFLFRKHEQGNNAVEIPQFEPIVADFEKKIGELKKPKSMTFELIKIQ